MADSSLVTHESYTTMCTPTNGRSVRLAVVHTLETPDTSGRARWAAEYFKTVQASAHYIVDDQDIVQAVHEWDMAWAAPGSNEDGIQIEQAGYAGQTPAQWQDAYSQAMLRNTARLLADVCTRNGITLRKLTPGQIAAGMDGVCGHIDVNNAYGLSDHWDPGPSYPWDQVMSMARTYAGGGTVTGAAASTTNTDTNPKEWDEMATKAEVQAACKNAVKDAIINDLDGNIRSKMNKVITQECAAFFQDQACKGSAQALAAPIKTQGLATARDTSVQAEAAWAAANSQATRGQISTLAKTMEAGTGTTAVVTGDGVSAESLEGVVRGVVEDVVRRIVREELDGTSLTRQGVAA